MDHLLHPIALTMIPKVGPVTARQLVSYCGSPRAVFEAGRKELLAIPGIGPQITTAVLEQKVLLQAERELEFIDQHGITACSYLDPGYPERLKPLYDSPVMLYFQGQADLNALRTVAIVGTRKPTAYGVSVCEEVIESLAALNVQIISGLAFGIDIAAHKKCTELGIPTIGVLGHGLGMVYPGQHRPVARRMMENGGLLTEFTSQVMPEREHFPLRNRIIAGLCDALVVIETAEKGGSMISAFYANEYNRDVFAVPGRIRDPAARGCNNLIKSHRAALLSEPADIGYVMRWDGPLKGKGLQRQLFVELDPEEEIVVNLLRENPECGIDFLLCRCGMAGSMLAAVLLNLEFKGVVRALPGKRYAWTG
ncbi:MAG TPA: DNA-processing protein DprA [Flavilitoribacter sp.]|nr:DNA-processing protein DprA [Flavilitoribacter sp.]HMQ88331.1 DNA-processing protein DprA [Flavilitoribacter sp.]